jgi:signal transduction histidine kinase
MSQPDTFDVNEALSEIIHQYQRTLSHQGIRLRTDIAHLGNLRYYRLIFQEIMTNLIINAQEAIEAAHRSEGEISITALRKDNRLVFTIKDNGCGMSSEIQARIFEPLFTTKENGMGWGLYFVYQNLHSCQGDVTISSLEGVGTTMTISLPVP